MPRRPGTPHTWIPYLFLYSKMEDQQGQTKLILARSGWLATEMASRREQKIHLIFQRTETGSCFGIRAEHHEALWSLPKTRN